MSASHVYRSVTASQPRTPKPRVYYCMACKNEVDNSTGGIGIIKVGKKFKKGPVHTSCV